MDKNFTIKSKQLACTLAGDPQNPPIIMLHGWCSGHRTVEYGGKQSRPWKENITASQWICSASVRATNPKAAITAYRPRPHAS